MPQAADLVKTGMGLILSSLDVSTRVEVVLQAFTGADRLILSEAVKIKTAEDTPIQQ